MIHYGKELALEELTEFYREGKGVDCSRYAFDPVRVGLDVNSGEGTIGRITLTAYLHPDFNSHNRAIDSPDYRLSTFNCLRERMDVLDSRGLRRDVKIGVMGTAMVATYERHINSEEDLVSLVDDLNLVA